MRRAIFIVLLAVFAAVLINSCSSDKNSDPKVEYSWKSIANPYDDILYAVGGTGSDNVYFGGASGRLLHWDGTSLSNLERFVTRRISDIFVLNENSIWMCTYGDSVFHYNGTVWTGYAATTGRDLHTIWAFSDTDVWVAGKNMMVAHYDGEWESEEVSVGGGVGEVWDWEGIWASASDYMILVGRLGHVCKYTGAWQSIITGTDNGCSDAWGSATDDIHISAYYMMFHYSGGVSFDPWYYPLGSRYYGIWGSSEDDIFAVGDYDPGTETNIIHWNGSDWRYMTSNTIVNLRGVWGSGAKDVFAVGGSGVIMHYCED